MLDKKLLSEADICTQFITPAIQQAGWDFASQVRQEVTLTDGRIEGTKIVVEVEEERSPDIVRVSCAKPKAGPRKKPGDDGQGSLL